MKKKLIEAIERYGMGLEEYFKETDSEFTFTCCKTKHLTKLKNILKKAELKYTENFEVDGGYPFFMVTVNNRKLKKLVS